MKKIFCLIFITACISSIFIACDKRGSEKAPASTKAELPVPKMNSIIIGERLKSDVNVSDKHNGQSIFTLKKGSLVSCSPLKSGFYKIGVVGDIKPTEFGIESMPKNSAINNSGKEIGKVLNNMKITTSTDGVNNTANYIGYIPKAAIDENSIIERVFEKYYPVLKSKCFQDFDSFITVFKLEFAEELTPFQCYRNFENWLEDPSPMYRFILVFKNNRFVGVVHSRAIKLSGTSNSKLTRGFAIEFDNSTAKDVKVEFINKFNKFVSSVD